ncbi:hypothetical protein phiOC_p055 [Ochrobactrum phage vB_OspM_OC]|nr:hypothetical protein phiOC_p055 [Ochrobactrum phage vB_OspM_OC]
MGNDYLDEYKKALGNFNAEDYFAQYNNHYVEEMVKFMAFKKHMEDVKERKRKLMKEILL